ncbi:hypothetical protein [Sanguibacter gelidistatuariae]|uniref:hypothetical protein n=1 Tax=Sanguibacter gelidistatuariae TaxID=1814289 RepID=UPI000B84AD8C|nr:hypothetical protein [Sanguibacter gelidistatuariae]
MTGWLGLERLAAFSTSTPTYEAYVDAEIFDQPGLKRSMTDRGPVVADGGRVTFYRGMAKREQNIWRTGVDGTTVSLPRLYADLLRSGVRGRDAAEHLRETRMGF